jgi:hypothetical protein
MWNFNNKFKCLVLEILTEIVNCAEFLNSW